jgi:hypothetical protein
MRVRDEYPVCAMLERDLRASQALGQVPVGMLVHTPEDETGVNVILHQASLRGCAGEPDCPLPPAEEIRRELVALAAEQSSLGRLVLGVVLRGRHGETVTACWPEALLLAQMRQEEAEAIVSGVLREATASPRKLLEKTREYHVQGIMQQGMRGVRSTRVHSRERRGPWGRC